MESPNKPIRTLDGSEWIKSVCFAGKGLIASASETNFINIWDLDTGVLVRRLQGHTKVVRCVSLLESGHLLSGSFDFTVRVWNPRTEQCLLQLNHGDDVKAACGLGNEYIASGGLDNTIKIWQISSGQCIRVLTGHRHCVQSVCDLGDGMMASGSTDHEIRIWNLNTGKSIATLKGHQRTVWCVCPAGGTTLASAGMDTLVKIWDYSTGECLTSLTGHNDSVFTICKIGHHLLASGSQDNTVRIWDSQTYQCLQIFSGHLKGISSITKVQNSELIASGSFDTTIKVWKVRELVHRNNEQLNGQQANSFSNSNVRMQMAHNNPCTAFGVGDSNSELIVHSSELSARPRRSSRKRANRAFRENNGIEDPLQENRLRQEAEQLVEIRKHEMTKQILEDHGMGLEEIENHIELYGISNELVLAKRDFIRGIKNKDQKSCVRLIDQFHSQLYMFQSFLDKALNTEMTLFKNKYSQMKAPRKDNGFVDPYDYNITLKTFRQMWNERNDNTELLMSLWSRCSNIHVSKMTSLTEEFDTKNLEFQAFECQRTQLTQHEKPDCAKRLTRLEQEIKRLKEELEAKERLLDSEYLTQIQIETNIQNADTNMKDIDKRKQEITTILEQHRAHSAQMSKLTEEINSWRKNMHSHLLTFQARLSDVRRKFEIHWRNWQSHHIVNWMCSLDESFNKYRYILQRNVPAQIDRGVALQYINVQHLHQIGIAALRDRVAIHREIQRIIHLDSEGMTQTISSTMNEQNWRKWRPEETINWICGLDGQFESKYRIQLEERLPEQIIIGEDMQYLNVDLLISLGIEPLSDRGVVMQNMQRLKKLSVSDPPNSRNRITFE